MKVNETANKQEQSEKDDEFFDFEGELAKRRREKRLRERQQALNLLIAIKKRSNSCASFFNDDGEWSF